MREMDARLFPSELETFDVRRDQVDQQPEAQGVAAREKGRHPPHIVRSAQNQEALEPTFLRLPQAFVHLRNRSQKHQQSAQEQEHHRDFEGRQKFPETICHERGREMRRETGRSGGMCQWRSNPPEQSDLSPARWLGIPPFGRVMRPPSCVRGETGPGLTPGLRHPLSCFTPIP